MLLRLRAGWKTVLGFFGGGIALAILLLHLITNQYMIIAPAESTDQLGTAATALASAAGLSSLSSLLGSSTSSDFARYQALLTSTDVAKLIIRDDPNIMHSVFWKSWDSSTNTYNPPGSIFAWPVAGVMWVLGFPAWHPPGQDDLANVLTNNVSVIADDTSTTYTIAYSNPDRKAAVRFLADAHHEADTLLRNQELAKHQLRVQKLNEWLKTVTLDDQRQVVLGLLANELSMMLTLNTDKYLASDMLAPPIASTDPTWPSPPMFLIAGALLGLIVGCTWVWLVDVAALKRWAFVGRLRYRIVSFGPVKWSWRRIAALSGRDAGI